MERIDRLKPHPRNYREHPADQLAHIKESIKRTGIYRNVVIANDGTILAGHGVVMAARGLGMEEVPVIELPVGPDDPTALKVLVGDNEIANIGEVDDRRLSELLTEIQGQAIEGLCGTGFSDEKLADLVDSLAEPEPPTSFPSADENIDTQFQCPKCAYKWSGKPS